MSEVGYEHRPLMLPAPNTLKLVELLGPAKAARALGISQTTLAKIRATNKASHMCETAARSWLAKLREVIPLASAEPVPANGNQEPRQETEETEPHLMYLLDVPASRGPLVEKMAATMGARFIAA